jgi:hypothetical protein
MRTPAQLHFNYAEDAKFKVTLDASFKFRESLLLASCIEVLETPLSDLGFLVVALSTSIAVAAIGGRLWVNVKRERELKHKDSLLQRDIKKARLSSA